ERNEELAHRFGGQPATRVRDQNAQAATRLLRAVEKDGAPLAVVLYGIRKQIQHDLLQALAIRFDVPALPGSEAVAYLDPALLRLRTDQVRGFSDCAAPVNRSPRHRPPARFQRGNIEPLTAAPHQSTAPR